MQCSQCPRPAFWAVGDDLKSAKPLCLACYATFQHVQTIEFLKHAAMLNNASHEMDSLMPIGPMHKPIPVAEIARAMSKADTFNNIRITNSTVGAVNTGNVARINAAIEITKGQPTEEFGARLKLLTEAIANSNEASADTGYRRSGSCRALQQQGCHINAIRTPRYSFFGNHKDPRRSRTVACGVAYVGRLTRPNNASNNTGVSGRPETFCGPGSRSALAASRYAASGARSMVTSNGRTGSRRSLDHDSISPIGFTAIPTVRVAFNSKKIDQTRRPAIGTSEPSSPPGLASCQRSTSQRESHSQRKSIIVPL